MNRKRNVGLLDSVLRMGVGVILASAGYFKPDLLSFELAAYLFGVAGLLIFLTGLYRFCPLYILLGFSSCHAE